jgi:hypothetical protein
MRWRQAGHEGRTPQEMWEGTRTCRCTHRSADPGRWLEFGDWHWMRFLRCMIHSRDFMRGVAIRNMNCWNAIDAFLE